MYSTIGASLIFLAILISGFSKVLETLPKNNFLLQQPLILWLYGLKTIPIQDVSRRRTSSECIHLWIQKINFTTWHMYVLVHIVDYVVILYICLLSFIDFVPINVCGLWQACMYIYLKNEIKIIQFIWIVMDASKAKSNLSVSLGVFIVCVSTGIFNALQRTVAKNLSHINPAVWTSCHFLVIWFLAWPFTLCQSNMLNEPPTWKGLIKKRRIIFALMMRSFIAASNCIIFQFALKVSNLLFDFGIVLWVDLLFPLQHLNIADATMISSTAPMYTVFWARWFLKEPILKVDLLNFLMMFCGVVLIARPPFLFGETDLYANDPNVVWAFLALILHSMFFVSNVFVMLRLLKG